MASGTEYAQEYQQAQKAYVQGNYEEAAGIVDRLVREFPQDPSASLLRGHIYCYGLQQYDVAQEQYQSVLELTTDPEFTGYATDGLTYISQFNGGDAASDSSVSNASSSSPDQNYAAQDYTSATTWQDIGSTEDNLGLDDFGSDQLDFDLSNAAYEPGFGVPSASYDQFDTPFDNSSYSSPADPLEGFDSFADPFSLDDQPAINSAHPADPFQPLLDDIGFASGEQNLEYRPDLSGNEFSTADLEDFDDAFAPLDLSEESYPSFSVESDTPVNRFTEPPNQPHSNYRTSEDDTLFMGSTGIYNQPEPTFAPDQFSSPGGFNQDFAEDTVYNQGSSSEPDLIGQSNADFLDEFDEFDDLGNLSDFDLSENSAGFTSPAVNAGFDLPGANSTGISSSGAFAQEIGALDFSDSSDRSIIRDDEVFSISGTSDQVPTFTQIEQQSVEPNAAVEQGALAFL